MRSIIAVVIVAVGYSIIALAAPSTATADECPPGYYWSKAHSTCVERPDDNPVGAVALCGDGKYSHSESRSGTCSNNGGVAQRCPCGGAATPPQPESDADQVFLTLFSQIPGIHLTDQAAAIASAHAMCADLQSGKESPADAAVKTTNNTGLTPEHATAVVNAAITAYCPQFLH
ncbi:DUF732 domain-containing protein [Mycobacterium sp. IEC1808]|uniref:DUF732 domain-containing protein n=1 Tax=Mycobacterium sp. IEC1808 TaxID=1743230 RepID=UPI001302C03A|nr:DUF732 domain-containing protein [Mycobacterium sp. IEC1808]